MIISVRTTMGEIPDRADAGGAHQCGPDAARSDGDPRELHARHGTSRELLAAGLLVRWAGAIRLNPIVLPPAVLASLSDRRPSSNQLILLFNYYPLPCG